MWAWIGLTIRPEHELEQSGVAMTKTWLTRSSPHPLTLRVISPDWIEPRNTYVYSVMEAILPHSTRWKDIRFMIGNDMLDTLTAVKDLPCLQTLAIDSFDLFDPVSRLPLFDNAPGLRCVELGYNVSSTQFALPWAQLIEYSSDNTTAPEILAILEQTLHLVKCTLRVLEDETPLHRHVRLPLLQSLEITSYINPADPFNHLSLPALRDFHYSEREPAAEEGWPNSQFVALLKRSSFLLQTLNIDGILKEGDLIKCLRCMPMLVMLELSFQGASCIMSETLSCLTNRGPTSDQCLVPGFGCLDVHCYGALDGPAWIDMIESRWRLEELPYSDEGARVSRLKRVAMHRGISDSKPPYSRIDLHTIKRLCHFKSEGLAISVRCGFGPFNL